MATTKTRFSPGDRVKHRDSGLRGSVVREDGYETHVRLDVDEANDTPRGLTFPDGTRHYVTSSLVRLRPRSPCEGCSGDGIRNFTDNGDPCPAGWNIVERCSACDKFSSDREAALALYEDVLDCTSLYPDGKTEHGWTIARTDSCKTCHGEVWAPGKRCPCRGTLTLEARIDYERRHHDDLADVKRFIDVTSESDRRFKLAGLPELPRPADTNEDFRLTAARALLDPEQAAHVILALVVSHGGPNLNKALESLGASTRIGGS